MTFLGIAKCLDIKNGLNFKCQHKFKKRIHLLYSILNAIKILNSHLYLIKQKNESTYQSESIYIYVIKIEGLLVIDGISHYV